MADWRAASSSSRSALPLIGFRAVSSLIPENIPLILESPVREEDINREIELARRALPVSPTSGRPNTRAAGLRSAIA